MVSTFGIVKRTITEHFSHTVYRRLTLDAGWLLSGNSAAAILGLFTAALAARGLGAADFGVLAVVAGYALFIDGLVNFQSWQSLIKFGAAAQESGDASALKRLVKLCLMLDLAAVLIGASLGYAGIEFAAQIFGWSDEIISYARWFCVVVLTHVSGVPIGILRLFGRFKLLSFQPMVGAATKLIGVTILFAVDGVLSSYVFVWALTDVVGNIVLIAMGWYLCSTEDALSGFWRTPLRARTTEFRSVLRFLLITNVNSSIQLAVKRLDILVIGGVLGNAAAGLYKVVKMFAQIPNQISGPFYQAVYPQLARYVGARAWEDMRNVMKRLALLMSVIGIGYWLGYLLLGYPLLISVFGEEFALAWVPGLIYLLGAVVGCAGLPLQPAILSFGTPQLSLVAHLASNAAYVVLLLCLLPLLGLVGAGVSFLGYYLIWTALMLAFLLRSYKAALGAASSGSKHV